MIAINSDNANKIRLIFEGTMHNLSGDTRAWLCMQDSHQSLLNEGLLLIATHKTATTTTTTTTIPSISMNEVKSQFKWQY